MKGGRRIISFWSGLEELDVSVLHGWLDLMHPSEILGVFDERRPAYYFLWSGELESWMSAYFMDGSISRRRYGADYPRTGPAGWNRGDRL